MYSRPLNYIIGFTLHIYVKLNWSPCVSRFPSSTHRVLTTNVYIFHHRSSIYLWLVGIRFHLSCNVTEHVRRDPAKRLLYVEVVPPERTVRFMDVCLIYVVARQVRVWLKGKSRSTHFMSSTVQLGWLMVKKIEWINDWFFVFVNITTNMVWSILYIHLAGSVCIIYIYVYNILAHPSDELRNYIGAMW